MCSGCGHDDQPPTQSSATLSQFVLHLTGTVLERHSLIKSHNLPSWFHIRRIPSSDLGKGMADILHVSHSISTQILVQQLQQEASYSSFTSSFRIIESKIFNGFSIPASEFSHSSETANYEPKLTTVGEGKWALSSDRQSLFLTFSFVTNDFRQSLLRQWGSTVLEECRPKCSCLAEKRHKERAGHSSAISPNVKCYAVQIALLYSAAL